MGRFPGEVRLVARPALIAVLAAFLVVVVAGWLAGAGPARSAPLTPAGTITGTAPTPTPSGSATPTPSGTTPQPADDLLRPDLRALPASDPMVQVRTDGQHRLRFTSALANVGIGPMEVRPNQARPCPPGQHNSTQIIYRDANDNGHYNRRIDTRVKKHRAGCMVFHPFHNHWHFKASARYVLINPRDDDDVVVSARRKVSFCLRDSARVPRWLGRWHYDLAYAQCGRRTPQGISIGWMDVYQSFLAGQYLPLPDRLRPGVYCLKTVVDPLDQLIETNDSNNQSMRALWIRGTRVERRDTARCR